MATATKNAIKLKGSTDIVTEFFDYAINNILYQRGIYPQELFETKKKYGLSLLMTKDKGLRDYLNQVLEQISSWLMTGEIYKLVVVISDAETGETKERWNFDIETDKEMGQKGSTKPENEIVDEIRQIIRQITASVTFLPLLEGSCSFDLLVYTPKTITVPSKWEETEPKYITNAEEVRLRSFTTKIHKVEPLVAYQIES
jgi:mitotic spindle assembly checkpoint protein MAD2